MYGRLEQWKFLMSYYTIHGSPSVKVGTSQLFTSTYTRTCTHTYHRMGGLPSTLQHRRDVRMLWSCCLRQRLTQSWKQRLLVYKLGCNDGILRVKIVDYKVHLANPTTVFTVQNVFVDTLIAYIFDHEQPIVMGLVYTAAQLHWKLGVVSSMHACVAVLLL